MNFRLQFGLVFIFLVLNIAESSAWGPQGHRVIGFIAESHLKPEVRQLIAEKFNINSLADVATWADKVRKKRKREGTWHYTNIEAGQGAYDADRDCPKKACVTEKINEFSRVLADRSVAVKKRKDALKYLVHFVGDVHQPLHLGNKKDRGGGTLHFPYKGKLVSLHYLWDGGLLDWSGTSLLEYATRLNSRLPEVSSWNTSSVSDWANESRRLALATAYQVDKEGLSKSYIKKSRDILNLRLTQAGVRLANLLNTLLTF